MLNKHEDSNGIYFFCNACHMRRKTHCATLTCVPVDRGVCTACGAKVRMTLDPVQMQSTPKPEPAPEPEPEVEADEKPAKSKKK